MMADHAHEPFKPDDRPTVEAYLLGQLTEEQVAALDRVLRNDAQARDRFMQSIELMSMVREAFHGIEQQDIAQRDEASESAKALAMLAKLHEEGLNDPISLEAHRKRSRDHSADHVNRRTMIKARLIIAGGLAAVIAISAAVALVVSMLAQPSQDATIVEQPADEPIIVATLTDTHNAVWQLKPGESLRPDDALVVGQRLTLAEGFAEITTVRGAVAILEAPVTIELIDNDNALHLHAGKLVGICETESSKGFLVRTAHMDITDLGTRFGVYAQDNQITTTVFTGEVELTAPGGEPQSLTRNQTARLNTHGNNRKLDVHDQLAKGFDKLQAMSLASALRNDPAMIAYWGFEAEDIVDGKLLNRAAATQGKMDGTLGQTGKPDSSPTLTEGRSPGTGALRFEAEEFDLVRISQDDAKAIDGLEQFTIGVWVKPDHMDQMSHHLVTKRAAGGRDVLNFGLCWWDGRRGSGYARNTVFFEGRMGQSNDAEADSLHRRSAWMHLVVTYDRGERLIYLDGALIERLPRIDADRLAALDAELLIGAAAPHLNETGTYLDGDLDELFILGRSMSPDEIATLYETGVAQP